MNKEGRNSNLKQQWRQTNRKKLSLLKWNKKKMNLYLKKGGKLYSTVSNYGDKKNKRKNKIEKFNNAWIKNNFWIDKSKDNKD